MSSNPVEQSDFETDTTPENLDEGPAPPESSTNAAQSSFPFEAMSLKVGDRLQAQPPKKVSAERCFVRLIGYLQDLSMLITTPATVNSVRLQLMEGDQLVMRVFSSQNAFGFACDVQRVCKLPYSYLHISFPKEVQGTVIRKAARVKTKIIVKVGTEQAGGANLTGVISNLSANGALMDGPRKMAETGDSIRLTFRLKLHNIEADLSLVAIVRAVFDDETLKQSGTSLAHFGLEFVDLQPNDQMILQSMVYQRMIEHPQSLV
jgi:c-di-GMP-binding flagellar brake protein YcgR